MKIRLATGLAGLAVLGGVAVSTPAHAEDRRPCVSTTEYHSTTDVVKFRGEESFPTRRTLERRWEVRHRGVIDRDYSDSESVMWMYKVCGYSFEEAQVWILVDTKTRTVPIMNIWIEPGAMSNGHVYR